MKSFFIVFISIFSYLFNNVSANSNVVFIDLDSVLSVSKSGSHILKQLNIIKDKNIKDFESKAKILKIYEEKIVKQKNILSPEDFQLEVNKLKEDINKYNNYRDGKVKDYNQLKLDNTNKLLKLINLIITQYSKDESISIVLQKKNIINGKVELDITKAIIKIVDSNIKRFKIE